MAVNLEELKANEEIRKINNELIEKAMVQPEIFKPLDAAKHAELDEDASYTLFFQDTHCKWRLMAYPKVANGCGITLKLHDPDAKSASKITGFHFTFQSDGIAQNQRTELWIVCAYPAYGKDLNEQLVGKSIPCSGEILEGGAAALVKILCPITTLNLRELFDLIADFANIDSKKPIINQAIQNELIKHFYLQSIFGTDWLAKLKIPTMLKASIIDGKIDPERFRAVFDLAKQKGALFGLGEQLMALMKAGTVEVTSEQVIKTFANVEKGCEDYKVAQLELGHLAYDTAEKIEIDIKNEKKEDKDCKNALLSTAIRHYLNAEDRGLQCAKQVINQVTGEILQGENTTDLLMCLIEHCRQLFDGSLEYFRRLGEIKKRVEDFQGESARAASVLQNEIAHIGDPITKRKKGAGKRLSLEEGDKHLLYEFEKRRRQEKEQQRQQALSHSIAEGSAAEPEDFAGAAASGSSPSSSAASSSRSAGAS